MSFSSLKYQIKLALDLAAWGDKTLYQTLDESTLAEKVACLDMCLPFLIQARTLTGHRLLVQLLDQKIIMQTLDTYYRGEDPVKNQALLNALDKLHQGCVSVQWKGVKKKSPITPTLRQHVRNF